MGAIALPRRLHPDFSVKGKKPVGPVEIDWSHPMTADMTVCSLFMETGRVVELVNGGHLPLTDSATRPVTTKHTKRGIAQGVENHVGADVRPYYSLRQPAYVDATEVSFAYGVMRTDVRASKVWEASTYDYAGVKLSSGPEMIISNAATSLRLGYHFADSELGVHYDVVWTRRASTSSPDYGVVGYKNGVPQSLIPGHTTLSNGAATCAPGTMLSAATYHGQAFYTYFYAWTRELSQAEAKILANDPFCFLKPAAPLYFSNFTPDLSRDAVTTKYMAGGLIAGESGSTNVKYMLPDGTIFLSGAATYTAQAAGGANPRNPMGHPLLGAFGGPI